MNPNYRYYAIAAAAIAGAGVAIRETIAVSRREQLKREEIKSNMLLDLEAIQRASQQMKRDIAGGNYRTLEAIGQAFNIEIAFQKIAIREED